MMKYFVWSLALLCAVAFVCAQEGDVVEAVVEVPAVEETGEVAAAQGLAADEPPVKSKAELKYEKNIVKRATLQAQLDLAAADDPERAKLEEKLAKVNVKIQLYELSQNSDLPPFPEKPPKTATPEEKAAYKRAEYETSIIYNEALLETLEAPEEEAAVVDAEEEVAGEEDAVEEDAVEEDAVEEDAVVEEGAVVEDTPRVLKSSLKVDKERAKLSSKKSKKRKKDKKDKKDKKKKEKKVVEEPTPQTSQKLEEAVLREEFDRQYIAEHGEDACDFLFVDAEKPTHPYRIVEKKIAEARYKLAWYDFLYPPAEEEVVEEVAAEEAQADAAVEEVAVEEPVAEEAQVEV